MEGAANSDSNVFSPPPASSQIRALAEFVDSSDKVINDDVRGIILSIAKTGLTCFEWPHLKVLLEHHLNQVLRQIAEAERTKPQGGRAQEIEERRTQLQTSLQGFYGPPFTLQRLCELLSEPSSYSNPTKYLNALEKMFAVSGLLSTLTEAEYIAAVREQAAAFIAATSEQPPNSDANESFSEDSSSSSPGGPSTPFPAASASSSASTPAQANAGNTQENGEDSPSPEPMDVEV